MILKNLLLRRPWGVAKEPKISIIDSPTELDRHEDIADWYPVWQVCMHPVQRTH